MTRMLNGSCTLEAAQSTAWHHLGFPSSTETDGARVWAGDIVVPTSQYPAVDFLTALTEIQLFTTGGHCIFTNCEPLSRHYPN